MKCTMPDTSIDCSHYERYRRHDGRCNHKNAPDAGSAMQPLKRLLPPAYDAGGAPRGSNTGGLPSCRTVSQRVHQSSNNEKDTAHTAALFVFGQFLDHDIVLTPKGEQECKCGSKDPECFNIDLAPNDPVKLKCFEFPRSLPFQESCRGDSSREQFNQGNSWLDLSPVYGSSEKDARNLRAFSGGELKTSVMNNLPFDYENVKDPKNPCRDSSVCACPLAGDGRAPEQPTLTVMHTIFLRLHNRFAQWLTSLNPQWEDETTYQEARKITIATLQHITMVEYLPALFGKDGFDKLVTQQLQRNISSEP